MNDITVIIPCYNAQNTINRTLNSLEKQIYKKFNVIVIDDGSTDKTISVVEQYILHSSMNIEIVYQKNSGVSCARNRGILSAETPYITFLDADDEYFDNTLQILHDIVITKNVDLACGSYVIVDDEKRKKQIIKNSDIKLKSKYEMFEIYIHHKIYRLNFGCAIYKKDILKKGKIEFACDIRYGEDTLFFLQYLRNCSNNIAFIENSLYQYYNVKTSAMHIITYGRIHNVYACQRAADYWEDDQACHNEWKTYLINRALWAIAKDFACFSNLEFFSKLQREYDLKAAMKDMLKNGDEILIRISAAVYLISPRGFFYSFAIINKLR